MKNAARLQRHGVAVWLAVVTALIAPPSFGVVCADGLPDPGEECDDGNPQPGDGCNPRCRFECLSTDPTRNCQMRADGCKSSHCDDTIHQCIDTDQQPDGTRCGESGICISGLCLEMNLAIGELCFSPAQCASGHCVLGVCCESECLANCMTCGRPGAEGAGKCQFVAAGELGGACKDDGAMVCGYNGRCDGAGGCQRYPGNPCEPMPCTWDSDCASNICTAVWRGSAGPGAGICCNQTCRGPCLSCLAAEKGSGVDGICGVKSSCAGRRCEGERIFEGDKVVMDCRPNRCSVDMQCSVGCQRDADCAPGAECRERACHPKLYEASGGCGCRAARDPSSAALLLLTGLIAAAGWRVRRARRTRELDRVSQLGA